VGASIFDATGRYTGAFALMLVASIAAMVLSFALRQPRSTV
jgi:hypothetical protein